MNLNYTPNIYNCILRPAHGQQIVCFCSGPFVATITMRVMRNVVTPDIRLKDTRHCNHSQPVTLSLNVWIYVVKKHALVVTLISQIPV
jgi:hypothetical protein